MTMGPIGSLVMMAILVIALLAALLIILELIAIAIVEHDRTLWAIIVGVPGLFILLWVLKVTGI
jgi:hypothetical protein